MLVEGNTTMSGAEIDVVVFDMRIFRFTLPTRQLADTDTWRAFDIVIDSNDRVTSVSTANECANSPDESNILYPP